MNPLPAVLLLASFCVAEYLVPRTPDQPILRVGAVWRAGIFLALASTLLWPWLSASSILGLGFIAIAREVLRSVTFSLQARWPHSQLYLESLQLAVQLALLVAWLALHGGNAVRPSHSFHALLTSPPLGTFLIQLTGLVVAVGGGTVFIRSLLIQVGKAGSDGQTPSEDTLGVGRLIGNLERILIFGLAMDEQLDAVGLVLAAKSLARFKELEDKSFSEYYLLGTLSSTLFALLAAWLARSVIKWFYPASQGALTIPFT